MQEQKRLKMYLTAKEKRAIKRKYRHIYLALDIPLILGILGIFRTIYKYARHQIYSIREPNYALYIGSFLLCVFVIAASAAARSLLTKKLTAPVTKEEQKKTKARLS